MALLQDRPVSLSRDFQSRPWSCFAEVISARTFQRFHAILFQKISRIILIGNQVNNRILLNYFQNLPNRIITRIHIGPPSGKLEGSSILTATLQKQESPLHFLNRYRNVRAAPTTVYMIDPLRCRPYDEL